MYFQDRVTKAKGRIVLKNMAKPGLEKDLNTGLVSR
jgi:hypothetical protein